LGPGFDQTGPGFDGLGPNIDGLGPGFDQTGPGFDGAGVIAPCTTHGAWLADNDPDKAAEIITAAGLGIKKVAVRNKPDLEIRQGATSGSAIAIAKSRGKGTTYWWAISMDQKSWTGSGPTRTAKQSFANLTPGTIYYFRFQTLTKDGMSDWSQIVAFMVK
jgi:hypothetical protein